MELQETHQTCSWLVDPHGATIIEAQHQTISKRSELPRAPHTHKPTWVRASDASHTNPAPKRR